MATREKPKGFVFSNAAEGRHRMFTASLEKLKEKAQKALGVHKMHPDDFVAVCISVDSNWRPLVDKLMPGADWDAIRATGAEPVAMGIVGSAIKDMLVEEFPDMKTQLYEKLEPGLVRGVALDDTGMTVYDFPPAKS